MVVGITSWWTHIEDCHEVPTRTRRCKSRASVITTTLSRCCNARAPPASLSTIPVHHLYPPSCLNVYMPPRIIRARRMSARLRGANAPEDVETSSATGEETVTSSVAVPALTRQQALELLSSVVNDEDLAVLSVILADAANASALHKTCIHDDVSAIQTVLDSRVNVDAGTMLSVLTPLYIGNVNAARLLVEKGADKDKAKYNCMTPLYVDSQNYHLEVVRLLKDAGADQGQGEENRCDAAVYR